MTFKDYNHSSKPLFYELNLLNVYQVNCNKLKRVASRSNRMRTRRRRRSHIQDRGSTTKLLMPKRGCDVNTHEVETVSRNTVL